MSATAIKAFEVSALPGENHVIQPLLDLVTLQTHVQGAYVHRFDREGSATLVAFAGPAPETPASNIAPVHWKRTTVLVVEVQREADWRLSGFPEFQTGRFRTAVSLPLLDSGDPIS